MAYPLTLGLPNQILEVALKPIKPELIRLETQQHMLGLDGISALPVETFFACPREGLGQERLRGDIYALSLTTVNYRVEV